MKLSMDAGLGASYKSKSQMARLISESWGASNLYCVACESQRVSMAPPNTRAIDYTCPRCEATYQLKSGRVWNERRVPDAAYAAMIASIRGDRTPNLLVMQYSADWRVRNLLLIPSFFFSESAIEARPPLSPHARRAGWIGCNILLSEIAPQGKLRIVHEGIACAPLDVRTQYERVRPLAQISSRVRGWLLDVLNVVHRIGQHEFSLADVYKLDEELSAQHPQNQNIRPKIRQKLQVLRNLGLIEFLGGGQYRLCT